MAIDPQIRAAIVEHVRACMEFYRKELSEREADTWVRLVAARATPDQVRDALDEHMRHSRCSPKPNDVLKRVPKREKRAPVHIEPAPIERPAQSWLRTYVANLKESIKETP